MSREKGKVKRYDYIEPTTRKPLDARYLVPKYNDLFDTSNWGNEYIGMPVYVYDDGDKNGLYILKGDEVTIPANWVSVNKDGTNKFTPIEKTYNELLQKQVFMIMMII